MTDHAQPLVAMDLGSHDGYIGSWLLTQDVPVQVYGVELNHQGVEEAKRRGYTDVRQGDALDALVLYPELVGACDAVWAFELIEHVPDMGEFLTVCEAMLAPDGVVYLSTPDGCFGDGANPHHLRALRAVDLADLLRRRGMITNMTVGRDTITVASYKPAPRVGEAVIYTGPSWSRWHPMDINAKGLGGSETAAVHVAAELARLGWVVTVYGDIDAAPGQPGASMFGQVLYKHWSTFDPLEPCDLLISSRFAEVFERPNRARRRMLWVHDVDVGDRLTPAIAGRIDDVLVLSAWQAQHVRGRYPFLTGGKVRQIRNGISLGRFEGEVGERQARVLYTSSPDRGLDLVLEWWPEIRDQAKRRGVDATLAFAYAPVYWRVAEQDPTVGAHAARIRELAEQDGVEMLGSLGQRDLARLMRESLVWCAPSYNTPHKQAFQETSCIGAMEAQAAGCHVVASGWGALTETVQVGARIDGPPLSQRWRSAFIREIVRGLTDPAVQAHAQQAGPEHARSLGWSGVAEEISTLAIGPLTPRERAALAA